MEIGVGLARTAAERAEFTAHETDIGEIDIAVHDIADDVADEVAPKRVGRYNQCAQIRVIASWTIAVRQGVPLLVRKTCPILRFQHAFQGVTYRHRTVWSNLIPTKARKAIKFCIWASHAILLWGR